MAEKIVKPDVVVVAKSEALDALTVGIALFGVVKLIIPIGVVVDAIHPIPKILALTDCSFS